MFKKFFSKAIVMKFSGLFAMLPKLFVTIIIASITAVRSSNPDAWYITFMLVYPAISAIVDLNLLHFKVKIWTELSTEIPKSWDLTVDELLKYAKNLPKVRLTRFLSGLILLPFIFFKENWILATIPVFSVGFFVGILFDNLWLKYFKLKNPLKVNNNLLINKHRRNPPLKFGLKIGSPLWYSMQESDPFTIGSTSWYSRRHLNS